MTEEVKDVKSAEVKAPEDKSDVTKMSDADIKWREKYKLSKEELERTKLLSEKDKKELQGKIESASKDLKMLESKVIEAELKAQAVAAGIKDIDFVKLIDLKDVKMNEAGVIEGIDKTLQDFKARKPDLFGVDKKFSSSTNAPASSGSSSNPAPVNARNLSNDDWKKNRSRYMAGNFS
ncbi:MAG TPA: hypothetical protein VGW78_07770 [Candidatus Babeliales bacterium]|jgi:hypothetical protein|nr:hypothetical protein [Candidatus Babeliales bacterium]